MTDKNKDAKLSKQMKKVRWIDKNIFEFCIGAADPADEPGMQEKLLDSFRGEYMSLEVKCEALFQKAYEDEIRVRIRGPRNNGDVTNMFHVKGQRYRKGSGLFAIICGLDEKMRTLLKQTLDLLSLEGIGTDRSVGYGRFDYRLGETKLKLKVVDPSQATGWMNLSLFCPASQHELQTMIRGQSKMDSSDNSSVAYELVKRGGWMTTPGALTYRKQSVYMFTEGSIFKDVPATQTHNDALLPTPLRKAGTVIDLRPEDVPRSVEHPVWRDGIGLFLPVATAVQKD